MSIPILGAGSKLLFHGLRVFAPQPAAVLQLVPSQWQLPPGGTSPLYSEAPLPFESGARVPHASAAPLPAGDGPLPGGPAQFAEPPHQFLSCSSTSRNPLLRAPR